MRLSTGSTLGPYEITGPVGAGGMGEVYRARDRRLGREVAVKVLPHDVADNPERLARFEREARSASALNHPAIVTIHEFASAEGQSYLVMELVRGESLRDVLSRGPVPPRELFSIAAGVADGLATAHAAGIVHRDLKPENVMVTDDGAPKILDFGLVKGGPAPADLTATELHVTEAGVVYGTASYMSPEQARGEPVDFRSDQFALGLILSEMATGRHPFQRGTALETLASILTDDPEPLSDSLPEPFVWIVERCLAKRPSERYGSTADLARDLARLRDRPSGARPVTQRRRVAPTWWFGAGAAALLGALLVMATMWPRSSTVVGDALQVSVSMPEIAAVSIGQVAQPVEVSPDGRHLAIYGADAQGTNNLWIHDLRSGTTKLLAENAFAAAWSSDSRSIAYFAEGKLKTISIEGGPPQTVCDARPESTPSWHGDTILFAQYSRGPGIYRVSARGGEPPQLIVGPEKDNSSFAWWPQFLPDGKRFLFLTLRQPTAEQPEITHELFAGSLDGAAPQSIATIDSRAVFADGHLLFVRDGTLLARPFDSDTLKFTGEAVSLVDGLHYFRSTGLAAFSVSANGVLAWRAARAPSRLVWFDRNGMEVGSLGTLLSDGGRLSPDGKRLALALVDPKQGVSDIWVQDLSRDSPDRMTFQLLDEQHPVWGPDGTIYYRSDGGGGPPDVFKLTPGQGKEVVYRGPGVNEPHDVSPNGRALLLIDYTPPVGADISVLPLAPPGPARPFAATPFQELSPRFSPDGGWVAYSSDISGRPEVYVRPFEGSAAPVRVSQSGGSLPRWNPAGKELMFLGPSGRLMVVPVASSGFGVSRVLFQVAGAADFEVNPDGTRFLVHIPERREPVHLLINWRGRVPTQR